MYIKKTNMNFGGATNYEGLNTSKFKPGTQVYDFENDLFIVETTESLSTIGDITVITEAQYLEIKEEIESREYEVKQSIEDRVSDLETLILELYEVI